MREMAPGLLASAFCAVLIAPAGAQVADHLKCYKINDPVKLAGTADLNTPQFGLDPGCTLGKTQLFCAAATKTNVAVTDRATGNPITPLPVTGPSAGDRICYKIKCPGVPTDQTATDQFGTRTLSKFKVSLVCAPASTGSARFADNGDGTVTDHYTGLQWEKKDGAGGGANPANPHDVDNTYTWSSSGTAADGTAYTDFLSRLNTCTSGDGVTVTASFAAHCDWRLPTIAELRTIIDTGATGCGSGNPCIDPDLGLIATSLYWSSTTEGNPLDAWGVNFFFLGGVLNDLKSNAYSARAVRGGS